MTRKSAARSLLAAERRALAGENESQDSQEKLLFLIQEHGIGVTTSSPTPDDEPSRPVKGLTSAPTSHPAVASKQQQAWRLENASHTPSHLNITNDNANANANVNADTDIDPVTAFASVAKRSSEQRREIRSSISLPTPTNPRDAWPVDKSISPQTRDDAIPLPSKAPLKKKAKAMSSQSPTQRNEGRSYEQYTHEPSQPSSPPRSFTEEHRTLQEGDTGYVNFKYPFELQDTAPVEPDTPLPRNDELDALHDRSQFTSQLTSTHANRFQPETPAALPKPFIASGNGHVMPASQLFDQTQPTSALKKASPTSSRPSPIIFRDNVTSPTQPASSPLKNRGFGTSPLDAYVSTSPGAAECSSRPPTSRPSRSPSPEYASGVAQGRDEDKIDKTRLPKVGSRKGRSGLEPINEYQPYRKQVSDNEATRSSSQHSLDSDFERDDAELRRQRARSKKQKASKSFPEISVPPPSLSRGKVEVPSTDRAKRSKDFARTESEKYIAQCHEKDATSNDGSQETVGDSQDIVVQQKSSNETDTLVFPVRDDSKELHKDFNPPLSAPIENLEDKEMIPETSPAPTFAEPPKPFGDIMRENSSASTGLLPLSYPTPSTDASAEPSSSLNKPTQSERNTSAPPGIDHQAIESVAVVSSPSIVLASSQQSTRRRSSRLNYTITPSSSANQPLLQSDPGTTSSSLTVLSTTPTISSSLTPNTEDNHGVETADDTVSVPSPAAERGRRRGRPPSSLSKPSPSSTKLKTYKRPPQNFRKGTRHSSLSPDELDRSPSVTVSEDSRAITRNPPRKSTTLRDFLTKGGLFEGMVFAISFQERHQPQKYKDKSLSKGSIEQIIRQEGGTILDDGFNALFDFDTLPTTTKASSTPVLSSSLHLLDSGTGFAALIADGHSRKVKYMQALALGIPCLAPKWVTTCVSKKEIVDWSSYLLCAGSSTLLGDAIRSRNLQPYDASTARLAQVISQRPKLLDESKILLIMKKTKNEEKRRPYVFLAQVLGASLVRVNSVEEARSKLRESESGNKAFDWVYVDDHLHDARTALFGSETGEGTSKKRKRISTDTGAGNQPPKRIRTLNDELVIQSLILGRLIEEDEMEG